MARKDALLSGARNIIQHCLGLHNDDSLVIILDETTLKIGLMLNDAALSLGVQSTIILVPINQQKDSQAGDNVLNLVAQAAVNEAHVLLICVNDLPECTSFRSRLIRSNQGARKRIGHMPGATAQSLRMANMDFKKMIKACKTLEYALARGKKLELISYEADGTEHVLQADIGGWDRLPVISNGIIEDGEWGNVPSGETYISPIDGSGDGSIVINGSVPGAVILPGQEVVLHFKEGRLAKITPKDAPITQFLYEKQFADAIQKNDPHWAGLAEIGIGVATGIRGFTGNMLYDEKKSRTAHVALGDNSVLGGDVESTIHCDLLTKFPTVRVDGHEIITYGRLKKIDKYWQPSYTNVQLSKSPLLNAHSIARTGIQASYNKRCLVSEPHRKSGRSLKFRVGDEQTSKLACSLHQCIPQDGDWISIAQLEERTQLDALSVRQILHIISEYGLIKTS